MQGIILLNKPENITSFGAVAAVRRIYGTKRAGHTGTLDPMARGVLPVLTGRATALIPYMSDTDKSYEAAVQLGVTTDTEDITGNILSRSAVSVSEEELKSVIASFTGSIKQVPPMYSAIKKDGVRLYSLARQGVEIEREARTVEIYSAQLISFEGDSFTMRVHCGKGTYIRSLCRDIGQKLGCGAVLCSLLRTSAAGFDISETVSLGEITSENAAKFMLSSDEALRGMKYVKTTEKQAVRFCNGGSLAVDRLPPVGVNDNELVRVKYGEVLLGVGCADLSSGQIAVKCVINDKNGSDTNV